MATDPDPDARIHALVSGRVQRVSYRKSTEAEALRLGLRGWVRNLPDGRVELEAQGAASAVGRLLAWLHEGPPAARVEEVVVEDRSLEAGEATFEVRR